MLLVPFATLAFLAMAPSVAAAQAGDDADGRSGEEQAGAVDQQRCAVTGHVVPSRDELAAFRGDLRQQGVNIAGGTPLDRVDTWVLADGGNPVVVLDATAPLTHGEVFISAAGQRFQVDSNELAEDSHRYVTNVTLPHLGSTTRALGLEVESGTCTAALALSVDRSLWSTLVGRLAVAATALLGLLTVVVARLRKGGWLRRFLFAAPLGLLAGLGQVVVLHEAGVLDPFGSLPWWGPAAGVAVAALLPLTRWRARSGPTTGQGGPLPLARLAPGAVSGPQVVTLGVQVLDDLAAVHARDSVHGRVHPETIRLNPDGRARLTPPADPGPAEQRTASPPYASPEQLADEALDPRADLYSLAVVLDELLGEAPEPVAALLASARATDPGQRPASAEAFAERLRQAASEAYGENWAAGAAAAPEPATDRRGVSAAVGAAAAVAVAVALTAAAVLVDSPPAQARATVVTPEQAQVIAQGTLADGLAQRNDHIHAVAHASVRALATRDDSISDADLAGVEVGVPPDQRDYPAWFVASGEVPYDDGSVSILTRFDREAGDRPWQLTNIVWSEDVALAVPARGDGGWLAEVPAAAQPAVQPQEVADTYGRWVEEQGQAYADEELDHGEVVDYEGFEWLPHPNSYLRESSSREQTAEAFARPAELVRPDHDGPWGINRTWRMVRDERPEDAEDDGLAPVTAEEVAFVPLADGTVLLTVEVRAETVVHGTDEDGSAGTCGAVASFRYDGEEYQRFASEQRVRLHAWLPEAAAADGSAASPAPTASQAADDVSEAADGADEASPVLLADPVIATEHGVGESEIC